MVNLPPIFQDSGGSCRNDRWHSGSAACWQQHRSLTEHEHGKHAHAIPKDNTMTGSGPKAWGKSVMHPGLIGSLLRNG